MKTRLAGVLRPCVAALLALAMALGGVPAEALAEATDAIVIDATEAEPEEAADPAEEAADTAGEAAAGEIPDEQPEQGAVLKEQGDDIASGTVGTCNWSISLDGTLTVSPQDESGGLHQFRER